MTYEKIYEGLVSNMIPPEKAVELLDRKSLNYYINKNSIDNRELNDAELTKLSALVNILQILYTSPVGSPVSDEVYDKLQELLVNYGIPRLTGSYEINSLEKGNHKYEKLRGTLDKVYYLYADQPTRVNKSRRSLDEWIASAENKYKKNTGKTIDLSKVKVLLTPKFDGASAVLEIGDTYRWLTRGDTETNSASNISHIMNVFNSQFKDYKNCGIKFEVMCSEESFQEINKNAITPYKSPRQVVVSTINQIKMDYKIKYIKPIMLRIYDDEEHIEFERNYPFEVCELSDLDALFDFARENRYVKIDGETYRTDGMVISILDKDIQNALGRDNNINNYEVAYKFPNAETYSFVKDVEFYVSEFGYITPVVVFDPVMIKGNIIKKASLSNKERFDELDLHYGDMIKILYDVIPYVTKDEYCLKAKGKKYRD